MLLKACCLSLTLCVFSNAPAQRPQLSASPSDLLDSLAMEPLIHVGAIGYSGEETPRGQWLDQLRARKSEWWTLDSLDSERVTTRIAVLLALSGEDQDAIDTAFAKTRGDTARVWIWSGCTGWESEVAEVMGEFGLQPTQ